MSRRWVLDASPVLALGATDHLSLLTSLSEQLVIPSGVAEEISSAPADSAAVQWSNAGRGVVCPVEKLDPAVLAWDLGPGETEVISWARCHPEYEAVLDDRAARVCAAAFNVRVVGTLGIMLLAKRLGAITKVTPLLAALDEAGFRVDPSLRTLITQHAGE